MSDMEPLPIAAIEGLVPALLRVYALVHEISATPDFQRRENPTLPQELVDAADDFKGRIQAAHELLEKLPGGELHAASQDEVIQMLEQWRDQKRAQLQKHFPTSQ